MIRAATEADRPAWERLWAAYLEFYETSLPSAHTDLLWDRIHAEDHPVRCLVAEVDGLVAGIVHYFPHADTWEERMVCYLQDLFVAPEYRSRGIGSALITAVGREAGRHGWGHVYWLTAEDNATARRVYDRITGGPSGFISYEMDTDGNGTATLG